MHAHTHNKINVSQPVGYYLRQILWKESPFSQYPSIDLFPTSLLLASLKFFLLKFSLLAAVVKQLYPESAYIESLKEEGFFFSSWVCLFCLLSLIKDLEVANGKQIWDPWDGYNICKKVWYSQEIILYLNPGSNCRLLGFEDLKLKFWKDCPHWISLTSRFVLRLPSMQFPVTEFKSFCIHSGHSTTGLSRGQCNAMCFALVSTAAVMQLSFLGWLLRNISSAWKCNDATLFYRLPEIFCRKARLN